MTNSAFKNSGAFVSIANNATNEQVFAGYLLGQNSKVIIGIELPFLEDPESYISSNYEQIKHLNKTEVAERLDTWLVTNPGYVSFQADTHTVTVIQENTTDFKASIANDVYDFRRNKWGESKNKIFERPISISDNPMKPCDNVIIECVGSENVYFIINGLQCCVKCPNINGHFPYSYGIGLYNLVQDPNNPDMLNAELIQSFDAEFRINLLEQHSKAA